MNLLEAVCAIKQGILICNKSGKILYFNEAYAEYIGVSLEEAKGKKLTKYREGALAPEVLKTGVPIEGILRKEKGQEYFASVYPIIVDDCMQGSISVVTSIEQSKNQVSQKTGTLDERVRAFEKKEIEYMIALYGSDLKGKKRIAKELGISLATLYNKINESKF